MSEDDEGSLARARKYGYEEVGRNSRLVLDQLMLGPMIARIGDLGFSPNRTAVLGLSLVLLVNLVGAALLSARVLRRRTGTTRRGRGRPGAGVRVRMRSGARPSGRAPSCSTGSARPERAGSPSPVTAPRAMPRAGSERPGTGRRRSCG